MSTRVTYQIEIYDFNFIIDSLSKDKIIIYDVNFNNHILTFKSSYKYKKNILRKFPNIKIINEIGLLANLKNLFIKKTTLFSFIISLFFFRYLNSKIYDILITGDSRYVESLVINELNENNLKKDYPLPTFEELITYEKNIKQKLYDQIEFLEIRLQGVCIKVAFNKRRTTIMPPTLGFNLYASKAGIIKNIEIGNGEVLVAPNDYVIEGQLLVKDTILNNNKEEVYVGTSGKIYAITWTIIDLIDEHVINEVDSYVNLIEKGRNIVSYKFEEKEYISEEKILIYKLESNVLKMRIHYTCIENIAELLKE